MGGERFWFANNCEFHFADKSDINTKAHLLAYNVVPVIQLEIGYFNNISDRGAAALGDALKTNRTLASLELGHNNIGHSGAWSGRFTRKFSSVLPSDAR